MYLAYFPPWAELPAKFDTKYNVLNVFWNWPVSKGRIEQFKIFQLAFKSKNLVLSNASKNVENVIEMALNTVCDGIQDALFFSEVLAQKIALRLTWRR